MKKKFTALFIISMFLLSMIPLAFAQGGEEYSGSGDADPVPTEDVAADEDAPAVTAQQARLRQPVRQVVRQEVREEVREQLQRPAVQQKIKREVKQRIATPMAAVARAKIDFAKAREQYALSKEHYKDAKEKYLEQRGKFARAKEAYKECKGVDSEDCNEKRGQLKENAKPHLEHAADLVLKEIERIKAKIEASEDLSDEDVKEMLAELDNLANDVDEAKQTIADLDEDAPSGEYNAAVKQIREAWAKTKPLLKKQLGRLANARLGNIIQKTEVLEKRLYNAVDKLEEQGKDNSELESMMDDFSAKLDEAADKYQKAREIWSDANTPGEVDEATKEIHELMKEAQAALKDARDMLREIVSEIKAQNRGSLDVVASDEGDVEDSDDGEVDDSDVEEEESAEDDESDPEDNEGTEE